MLYPPGRYGHRFVHPGRLGWFGGLLWLVFLAGLVALVVALVLWAFDRSGRGRRASAVPPVRPDDAIAALRMRYARGEVSRDDYVRTAADLGVFVPPPPGRAAGQVVRDAPPPPSGAAPVPPASTAPPPGPQSP